MKCELTNGTAVTYVPESALGFRIITPEADIVDYGTRFSVTVFEETGETHTRVSEGKVKVEYRQSDPNYRADCGATSYNTSKGHDSCE
jgi:ferric-dicitrate binding protein FerR (iron transport regulator)